LSRLIAEPLDLGVAVAIFSHVSVVTMAGLGAVLAGRWLVRRDFRTGRPLALTVPIWAVASLCTVVAAERSMNPETRAFMQRFWSRTGFPPLPFRLAGTSAWVLDRLQNFFAYEQLLRYPLAPLYAVAMSAGLLVLWRRRSPSVALSVYAPLFVALAAAVARRYPLESRLSLYLLPAVFLGVAATIDALERLVAGRDVSACICLSRPAPEPRRSRLRLPRRRPRGALVRPAEWIDCRRLRAGNPRCQ
jgi:hypothetical protein